MLECPFYQDLFKSHHFRVVHTGPGVKRGEILAHMKADDIYSYVYIGHGAKESGSMDELASDDEFDVVTAARHTNYAIFSMDVLACYANVGEAGWATNVSANGGTLATVRGRGWTLNFNIVSARGTG